MDSEIGASARANDTTPLQITFRESGRTVLTDGATSILDVAEEHGIELDFGCRGGGCGRCKVVCVCGSVEMSDEDGLEVGEKCAGFVLACTGCPRSHITLDA